MSSVMPFAFNAVELCVAIINEKPWARAREVRRALEYGKATKTANVVKQLCSKENYAHKCQLTGFVSETKPMDWPKDLKPAYKQNERRPSASHRRKRYNNSIAY